MTDEKPSARALLNIFETDPAAFWLEVSRAITPGPWEHDYDAAYEDAAVCARECGANNYVDMGWVGDDGQPMPHCPVPPELTDPPEVVAFKLKAKVDWPAYLLEHIDETIDDTPCDHIPNVSMALITWMKDFIRSGPEVWTARSLEALGVWRA